MAHHQPSWHFGGQLDRLYRHQFDLAERKTWWRLDTDVDWEGMAPSVSDDLVSIVETFWAIEMFLPDYTSTVASQLRTQRGRVWMHTMWAYEESRHSRALEEWMLRSGNRTEQQLDDLSQQLWANTYELPYVDHRRLLVYQMLQEGATRMLYSAMREQAQTLGDTALADVCRLIAADEMKHYRYFRSVVEVYLAADPEGTTADLYHVLLNFEMPARDLVPDFEHRDAQYREYGLVSLRTFVENVWLRSAEHLGVDPLPPELRPLREQGIEMPELMEMLDLFPDISSLQAALAPAD